MQEADVAHRLGHLLLVQLDHPVVHPDLRQLGAMRGPGLGRLVLVMGEDQVRPAAVDVEAHAQQLLGHRGALDVPARPAAAPGGLPGRVLPLLGRLPQREVERITLALRSLQPLPLVVRARVSAPAVRGGAVRPDRRQR